MYVTICDFKCKYASGCWLVSLNNHHSRVLIINARYWWHSISMWLSTIVNCGLISSGHDTISGVFYLINSHIVVVVIYTKYVNRERNNRKCREMTHALYVHISPQVTLRVDIFKCATIGGSGVGWAEGIVLGFPYSTETTHIHTVLINGSSQSSGFLHVCAKQSLP